VHVTHRGLVCGGLCPALRSVQLWCQPSVTCPSSVVESIEQTILSLQSRHQSQPIFESQRLIQPLPLFASIPRTHETPSAEVKDTQRPDIPSAFLDPITCAIMTDPVRLPSGHILDRTTIQKHWREHHTDPFTNISMRYTDIVADISLRLRIQKYIDIHAKQ